MNPILFTVTFLTMISLLTSSEFLQRAQGKVGRELLMGATQQQQESATLLQKAAFEDLRAEQPATHTPRTHKTVISHPGSVRRSVRLQYNTARPPNNSRLNFYTLIQDRDPFTYEVAARLMKQLYEKCSFYTPHCEYRILDALIASSDQMKDFTYPDELATIDLKNSLLQEQLYHMLSGKEAPALLYYITYDSGGTRTQKKINLLFASPQLIDAIFDHSFVSEQILVLINEIWEEIHSQVDGVDDIDRLTRTQIRKDFMGKFERILISSSISAEEAKKLFDFTLGKTGNILLIEDPKTGTILRKKVPFRSK